MIRVSRKRRVKLDVAMEPGRHDDDDVLFHASFAILGNFVEVELGLIGPKNKWAAADSAYRGYRIDTLGGHNEAAIDLWFWYRQELPTLVEMHRSQTHWEHDRSVTLSQSMNLEQIKDEKLRALIDIRSKLWT